MCLIDDSLDHFSIQQISIPERVYCFFDVSGVGVDEMLQLMEKIGETESKLQVCFAFTNVSGNCVQELVSLKAGKFTTKPEVIADVEGRQRCGRSDA